MTLSMEFQEQLEIVRVQFLDKMDDVILELDTLATALADGKDIGGILEAIRFRVHKLAGTAPTFGYRSIGALAAEAETAIDAWKQSQFPFPPSHIADILEKLLDEMEHTLDLDVAAPAAAGAH